MGLLFCLVNFAVLFAEEQTRNKRDLQKGIGLERFGFEKSWTFLFCRGRWKDFKSFA